MDRKGPLSAAFGIVATIAGGGVFALLLAPTGGALVIPALACAVICIAMIYSGFAVLGNWWPFRVGVPREPWTVQVSPTPTFLNVEHAPRPDHIMVELTITNHYPDRPLGVSVGITAARANRPDERIGLPVMSNKWLKATKYPDAYPPDAWTDSANIGPLKTKRGRLFTTSSTEALEGHPSSTRIEDLIEVASMEIIVREYQSGREKRYHLGDGFEVPHEAVASSSA